VAKFKKKPVIVEAYQTQEQVQIETLEGAMIARPSDWIVTEATGKEYACANSIFRRTYVREFEPENPNASEHRDLVDEYLAWYPELKPIVKDAYRQVYINFGDVETRLFVLSPGFDDRWILNMEIIVPDYMMGNVEIEDKWDRIDDAMLKIWRPGRDYEGAFTFDLAFSDD